MSFKIVKGIDFNQQGGDETVVHAGIFLAIKNFHKQHYVTQEFIVQLLRKLPERHLTGLQSIVYLTEHELKLLELEKELHTLGSFYENLRAVFVFRIRESSLFSHVLYHEIGHYVFHAVIGSFLKKEWVTQVHRAEGFVSDYARTSPAEDFAECYAIYKTVPNKLSILKRKYSFMRYKVFS